jgi:tetratricopeptide (TPR) repeat protein
VGNLGSIYADLKNHDAALACFRLQLDEAGKMGNIKEQAIALASIAGVHASLRRYREAGEFFDRATPLYRRLERKYDLCGTLLERAEVCSALDDPGKARELAAEALSLAQEIDKQDIKEKARDFLNALERDDVQ